MRCQQSCLIGLLIFDYRSRSLYYIFTVVNCSSIHLWVRCINNFITDQKLSMFDVRRLMIDDWRSSNSSMCYVYDTMQLASSYENTVHVRYHTCLLVTTCTGTYSYVQMLNSASNCSKIKKSAIILVLLESLPAANITGY